MTPAERLSAVDVLLRIGAVDSETTERGDAPVADETAGGTRTVHARAAAFLLRRALEDRLNTCLGAQRPALLQCSTRTQIAWLAHHAGSAVAGRYAVTWHHLSLACHYHRSIVPPTLAELRGWRDDVITVLHELPDRVVEK